MTARIEEQEQTVGQKTRSFDQSEFLEKHERNRSKLLEREISEFDKSKILRETTRNRLERE